MYCLQTVTTRKITKEKTYLAEWIEQIYWQFKINVSGPAVVELTHEKNTKKTYLVSIEELYGGTVM